jgi:hypothetical protein
MGSRLNLFRPIAPVAVASPAGTIKASDWNYTPVVVGFAKSESPNQVLSPRCRILDLRVANEAPLSLRVNTQIKNVRFLSDVPCTVHDSTGKRWTNFPD